MTAAVRGLVTRVIEQQEFAGKAELLAQVPNVQVVDGPVTFLNLAVDPTGAASEFREGPVPGQAWIVAEDGTTIGSLLVWVDDGYISGLEYAWVTEEPPGSLPSVDQLRPAN